METKKCFKCGVIKELNQYYKHRKMADGHLNKCKSCAKSDVKKRETDLRQNDPEWVERERERSRDKYHRLGYKDKQKEWDKKKTWKKSSVYKNLSKKFKTPDGIELHHWSYNDEHLEDVFFLPIKFHRQIHTKLILDYEYKMFRDLDGNLLDTKEKHKEFMDNFRS